MSQTVKITTRNNADALRMKGSRALAGLGTLRHNGGKVLIADVLAADTAKAALEDDDRVAGYEFRAES